MIPHISRSRVAWGSRYGKYDSCPGVVMVGDIAQACNLPLKVKGKICATHIFIEIVRVRHALHPDTNMVEAGECARPLSGMSVAVSGWTGRLMSA